MRMVKLGELVNIRTGKLDANASDKNGRYPFFTCSVTPLKINSYSYETECVLVAGNGDLNVKYYNGKFDAYQRTYIIESKDIEILNVKYLFHFLGKYVEKLRSQSIGGVIKYIKLGNLTEALIPIFSVDIQKKIVNVLEKSKFLIDKRQAQIEALDELTQSIFLEMFGDPQLNNKKWASGQIKDLTKSTQYGSSKKANEINGKYPILRMNNITYSGGWNLSQLKYIDLEDDEVEKYTVKKGDLLFNRTNSKELVGKSAVFREKGIYSYAGYLVRLRVNEKANSEFIAAYLNSRYGKRILLNKAKNIVGMANINAKELQSIPIYLPPKELQDIYAENVLQILSQKKQFEDSINKMDNLYNALLQKALKGELFQD